MRTSIMLGYCVSPAALVVVALATIVSLPGCRRTNEAAALTQKGVETATVLAAYYDRLLEEHRKASDLYVFYTLSVDGAHVFYEEQAIANLSKSLNAIQQAEASRLSIIQDIHILLAEGSHGDAAPHEALASLRKEHELQREELASRVDTLISCASVEQVIEADRAWCQACLVRSNLNKTENLKRILDCIEQRRRLEDRDRVLLATLEEESDIRTRPLHPLPRLVEDFRGRQAQCLIGTARHSEQCVEQWLECLNERRAACAAMSELNALRQRAIALQSANHEWVARVLEDLRRQQEKDEEFRQMLADRALMARRLVVLYAALNSLATHDATAEIESAMSGLDTVVTDALEHAEAKTSLIEAVPSRVKVLETMLEGIADLRHAKAIEGANAAVLRIVESVADLHAEETPLYIRYVHEDLEARLNECAADAITTGLVETAPILKAIEDASGMTWCEGAVGKVPGSKEIAARCVRDTTGRAAEKAGRGAVAIGAALNALVDNHQALARNDGLHLSAVDFWLSEARRELNLSAAAKPAGAKGGI